MPFVPPFHPFSCGVAKALVPRRRFLPLSLFFFPLDIIFTYLIILLVPCAFFHCGINLRPCFFSAFAKAYPRSRVLDIFSLQQFCVRPLSLRCLSRKPLLHVPILSVSAVPADTNNLIP